MADIEIAAALPVAEPADAGDCFTLGMIYSSGAGVAVDLVQAHKWFNIAAMRGHKDAAQLRREIAEQMSDAEIGQAQRAGLRPRVEADDNPLRRQSQHHVRLRNASRAGVDDLDVHFLGAETLQ